VLRFEHGNLFIGQEEDLCHQLDPLEAGGYLRGAITPYISSSQSGVVPLNQMVQFSAPPSVGGFGGNAASFADAVRTSREFPALSSQSENNQIIFLFVISDCFNSRNKNRRSVKHCLFFHKI
jgi:hypothetical protein